MESEATHVLTDQEAQMLSHVLDNIKGGILRVDWEAVAEAAELNSDHIALSKFFKIRKKIAMIPETKQAGAQQPNPATAMKSAMQKGAPTKLIFKNGSAHMAITEYDGNTMRLISEDEPAPKADGKNLPSIKKKVTFAADA